MKKVTVTGFNHVLLERAAEEVNELIRLGFGNFPATGYIKHEDDIDLIVFRNGSHAPAIWFTYDLL